MVTQHHADMTKTRIKTMLAMSTVADILIMGTFQTVLVGIIESVMGNSFWETLTAFDCNEGGRLRQAESGKII